MGINWEYIHTQLWKTWKTKAKQLAIGKTKQGKEKEGQIIQNGLKNKPGFYKGERKSNCSRTKRGGNRKLPKYSTWKNILLSEIIFRQKNHVIICLFIL